MKGRFMIGCVPEIIPMNTGNPDENINAVKSVEEAKEIVETAKKNNHKSNRAKKTDETE